MLDKIPRSHLYAATAIFLWSFAYPGTRYVVLGGYIDSAELAFIRNLIAAILFGSIIIVKGKGLPPLKDYPIFIFGGVIGFAVYMVIFNKGLETLNGGTVATLITTVPLICAVLGSVFFKEKLPRLAWFGMALAFCGVALLSFWDNGISLNSGILWTLGAALLMSLYNILQRYLGTFRKTRRYDSLQIISYSFFGAMIISGFQLPGALGHFMAAPPGHQIATLLMGIFPSAIAFALWTLALNCASTISSVTNYLFVLPLFVIIVCYVMLNEIPGTGTFIGGGVILGGLWLLHLAVSPKTPNFKKEG